jgi:hypothetical protein
MKPDSAPLMRNPTGDRLVTGWVDGATVMSSAVASIISCQLLPRVP